MFRTLIQERRRSLAVRRLSITTASSGPVFERFVNAAASAFAAPLAALSLIHDDEQTIKAGYGIPAHCLRRTDGICRFVLDADDMLECCDPLHDPRFAKLPAVVGELRVRYYIGAPLRLLNGIEIGALCVADTVARQPASRDQRAYLSGLARQASIALQGRLALRGRAA